jgi:hypothetical protein
MTTNDRGSKFAYVVSGEEQTEGKAEKRRFEECRGRL